MDVNRRGLLIMGAAAPALAAALPASAKVQSVAPPDPTEVVRLWPKGAPGGE